MKTLLAPFALIWMLLFGIVILAIRFVAMVAGMVLMLVGVVLTMTFIGAIVGIPLARTGWQLMVHGLG